MAKKKNNKNNNKPVVKKENQKKIVNNSRVTKNKELYDEDLTITKQQQFDFKDLHLENTLDLDTSFVDKKIKKREVITEKKTKTKTNKENKIINLIIIIFLLLIVLLSFFACWYYLTDYPKKSDNSNDSTALKTKLDENIVFVGDTITSSYDLNKYFENSNVINSGIQNSTICDLKDDLDNLIYKYNPSKIVIMSGINDLNNGKSSEEVFSDMKDFIEGIKSKRPYAKVYIQLLYPVNEDYKKIPLKNISNDSISSFNKLLKKYCEEKKIAYIDIYNQLLDSDKHLESSYTIDGFNLSKKGYSVVTKKIKDSLKDTD